MRTDFLIHWTGRDIDTDIERLNEAKRGEYVRRLADILKRGFWMTEPKEIIHGSENSWIDYKTPMTCFTEIRLSKAEIHTQRYGLLGIAVSRHFVLERFGGPVHYVRNHSTEVVIGNVQTLREPIKNLQNTDLFSFFGVNCSFLKAMSDKNTDNFAYLDEQEWRIVHTYKQVELKNIQKTGVDLPKYRISLKSGDICLIVFPDDLTRTLAVKDQGLAGRIHGEHVIPLLTVEECGQF